MTIFVLNFGGQLVRLDMATRFLTPSPERPGFESGLGNVHVWIGHSVKESSSTLHFKSQQLLLPPKDSKKRVERGGRRLKKDAGCFDGVAAKLR